MPVRILTLVTNGRGGTGPGHSALAVGSQVYTFGGGGDGMGGNTSRSTSGWKTLGYQSYLTTNGHRPVLVQFLNRVREQRVVQYVANSIASDEDYGTSGVCSQQVSWALDYALPNLTFDPRWFDTPFRVYHCARRLGLVQREQYLWPQRASLNVLAWARIANKLRSDYPLAYRYSPNGWTP